MSSRKRKKEGSLGHRNAVVLCNGLADRGPGHGLWILY